MNKIKILLLGIISLLCLDIIKAQEGNTFLVRDFEVWSGAKLKYKMSKDWSLDLEHQYRFKDNASVLDQNLTELALNRKLSKSFSTSFGLRYIRNNDTEGNVQGLEHHLRWNADLEYQKKLQRFEIKSRLRYQSKIELGTEEDRNKTFRVKLGTAYNIKNWKLDPEFSSEIFKGLGSDAGFNKLRFTLGTSYDFKGLGELSAFYRMEKELFGAYPLSTNILGVKYKYTFKYKKK